MIKFFRRIRQKQISEGKTGTYFKYAIGEIILVVIGILIALSISNWNEERKIKKAEIGILQNLKTELKFNLDDLKKINRQHNSELNDGIYLLHLFGTNISKIPVLKLD